MAITSTASGSEIVAVLDPTPELVAIMGDSYVVQNVAPLVSLTSPQGTVAIAGGNNAFTLDIAQQAATNGQVLSWNGAKFAPATVTGTGTVTNVSFGAPASTAFAVANPTTVPIISFQNVGLTPAAVFLRGDGTWNTPQGAGGVTITSPQSTIAIGGTATNPTIDIAQQAATVGMGLLWNGTKFAPASLYNTVQDATGTAVTKRQIIEFTGSGVASVVDDPTGLRTVVTITGGGGGGGTFTSSAIWTGSSANKNAQTSPGNINNQGITIILSASSGSGQITAATISLNGNALPGSYASSGSFPNLTIVIPLPDVTGNAAQTASTVTVSLVGTYGGSGVSIANAGTLTNTQPIAFTTTLSGSYNVASLPFYTTTATLNYSYTNSGAITSFGGVLTPTNTPLLPRNATSPTGSFANIDAGGITISGNAIGTGLNGAGSATVNLSGSVGAVATFTPAFYVQTANATIPTFTTASTQTPGSQINAVINYPAAIATTQYNWVATTQPVNRVFYVSPLGNSQIVPDSTSTAVISGVTFNIFGLTALTVGSAASILITA